MPRFKSITSRIIVLHLITLVMAFAAMSLALYQLMHHVVDEFQQESLTANAETISHYVHYKQNETLSVDLPQDLDIIYSESYGLYSFLIMDKSKNILFSSKGSPGSLAPNDIYNKLYELNSYKDQSGNIIKYPVVGIVMPKTIDGKQIFIEMIQYLSHVDAISDDVEDKFLHSYSWIIGLAFIIIVYIDIIIFKQSLRPVMLASKIARQIGPINTDIRLPAADMPTELRPLVNTVNGALDRLEEGFQIQRDFTADTAHELRTPLAILNARIDTLDDKKLAAEFSKDIVLMNRVVNQLLDVAQLETFQLEKHETADLVEVCREAAEFLAFLAVMNQKQFALAVPDHPVLVRGNAQVLFLAVRNLGENAIRHTAPGTVVEIALTEGGTISVTDSGPGIPDEHRTRIFERFWRGSGQKRDGAGLGLAIVQRIIAAHGGVVEVRNRHPAGAEFVLRLRS